MHCKGFDTIVLRVTNKIFSIHIRNEDYLCNTIYNGTIRMGMVIRIQTSDDYRIYADVPYYNIMVTLN